MPTPCSLSIPAKATCSLSRKTRPVRWTTESPGSTNICSRDRAANLRGGLIARWHWESFPPFLVVPDGSKFPHAERLLPVEFVWHSFILREEA
jgi:hypothetical protein